MRASIRPLAVPLYEWARRHGHELPPFPSADYLQVPFLPPAPCLPEDPKAQLRMAARTWHTGVQRLLGHTATTNPRVHDANKLCVAQLAALGIPPAEWLLFRMETYRVSAMHEQMQYPPFGFVYSPTALSDILSNSYKLDRWLGALATPRRYVSTVAQNAQSIWYKIRQAVVRREPTTELLAEYELCVSSCIVEHKKAEQDTRKAVLAGEYVW